MIPEHIKTQPPEIFSRHTLGPGYFPVICASGIRSFVVAPSLTEIVKKAGFVSALYVNGGGIHGLSTRFFPDNATNLGDHLLLGGRIINVAGGDMDVSLIAALHAVQPAITVANLPQIISFVYHPGTTISEYQEIIAIFGNPQSANHS